MGPAAWQRLLGRGRYGSRGTAAVLTVALNLLFVYILMRVLGLMPEAPALEPPMLASLFTQQRGLQQQSPLPAVNPHLQKLTYDRPDTPPNLSIELPIEAPPVLAPSDMHAALPSGAKDSPGQGSARGLTNAPGAGAGIGIVHQVAPVYSAISVESHEQGVVALRVLVDQQGRPTRVQLQHSSGFPRLDAAATNAALRYRFTPPAPGSAPEQHWATVKMEFDLLPMPVPTTILSLDSLIAQQISSASRADHPDVSLRAINETDDRLNRMARNLFDSLARRPPGAPDSQEGHTSPTPIQVLAGQGRLKSLRFLGFASRSFDCVRGISAADGGAAVCEVFEVRQANGTSYWLAMTNQDGTLLRGIAIALGARPLAVPSSGR